MWIFSKIYCFWQEFLSLGVRLKLFVFDYFKCHFVQEAHLFQLIQVSSLFRQGKHGQSYKFMKWMFYFCLLKTWLRIACVNWHWKVTFQLLVYRLARRVPSSLRIWKLGYCYHHNYTGPWYPCSGKHSFHGFWEKINCLPLLNVQFQYWMKNIFILYYTIMKGINQDHLFYKLAGWPTIVTLSGSNTASYIWIVNT